MNRLLKTEITEERPDQKLEVARRFQNLRGQCSVRMTQARLSGATETEMRQRGSYLTGFRLWFRPAKIFAGSGAPPPDEKSI
jgi:hypothetical protein